MKHTPSPSNGQAIAFNPGETILQAATRGGVYIPHLCYHPEFKPHGSCKLCTVKVNGRHTASCTMQAVEGMAVESNTEELNDERRALTQMLFVEGNHFCPSCEKSGNCKLQATAYELGMMTPHFDHFFPNRPLDASHPEFLLDLNRCILCSLCVRASRDVDGKNVFALSGRGIQTHVVVNAQVRPPGGYQFSRPPTRRRRFVRWGSFSRKKKGFACTHR